MKHIKIIITGKVQGVFFRESTREKAQQLGLRGTVQNLTDGSVLIRASGDEHAIESLLGWCHIGPPTSNVEKVSVSEADEVVQVSDFIVLR